MHKSQKVASFFSFQFLLHQAQQSGFQAASAFGW